MWWCMSDVVCFFFFKQKTAYEIKECDWSSDVCYSDLYVLLLAALRSVPKSLEAPRDYNDVNINGVLTMLQAASKRQVKRLVFSSSSSIYGDTDVFPEKEDALPLLISPYALSKLAGEYYCRIFSEFFNVETVCLRYFNVFGPKQALDDEYAVVVRSEERRVGKECRSRWSPQH